MAEPLDHSYFRWLGTKVTDGLPPVAAHWLILNELHHIEFVWLLVGDDNRAADGVELREYFLREMNLPLDYDPMWMNQGCSVLEMLIAFAMRAEFQTEMPVKDWFWEFLRNLQISEAQDIKHIQDVIHEFMWRTFKPSGEGGLFPLREPPRDQRKVEIWYQFCDYLFDQNRL